MIERAVTVALLPAWVACTAGWAAVLAGHAVLSPLYARNPWRAP